MRIRIKKIFRGSASVRDYQVKKAILRGEDITIQHGNEIMVVPHSKLKDGIITTGPIRSQIDGSYYSLVDFVWEPGTVQEKLL